MILNIICYIASAWCLVTYIHMSRSGSVYPNIIANAFGGIPLMMLNSKYHLWSVVILELLYIVASWRAILTKKKRPAIEHSYEGNHIWNDWSQIYKAYPDNEIWQERTCQCGNRDFRRVK